MRPVVGYRHGCNNRHHRPNTIEDLEGFGGFWLRQDAGSDQDPKVHFNFLGRSVGDPEVVLSIPTRPTVAFSQITTPLCGLCRTTISLLPQTSSLCDDDAVAQLLAAGVAATDEADRIT